MSVLFESAKFRDEFGVVRLEEWPEGLVLWVGGQIRWRSWGDKDPEVATTRLASLIRAAG
jgi:hypothetical protein